MEIIDFLVIIVGILSLLVAILIGWQIYRTITFERRMRDYVKNIVGVAQKEALDYANKKVAGAKLNLLTAIVTTQIDLENWDMTALICSYMSEALIGFEAPEEDINITLNTMRIPYEENRQVHVSIATTTKLRDSMLPLLGRSKLVEQFYLELGIMIYERRKPNSQ